MAALILRSAPRDLDAPRDMIPLDEPVDDVRVWDGVGDGGRFCG